MVVRSVSALVTGSHILSFPTFSNFSHSQIADAYYYFSGLLLSCCYATLYVSLVPSSIGTSGSISLATVNGGTVSSGSSGTLTLSTGAAPKGPTGGFTLNTGIASSGSSGGFAFTSGGATSGAGGGVSFNVGSGTSGKGGSFLVTAGSVDPTYDAVHAGGTVGMMTGSATSTAGR